MEISIHKKLSMPQSSPRPKSEQGSPFRRLPTVSDNRNCIWITQDILKEFKAQVAHAHTVTLKFNNINQRAKEIDSARRKLPSLLGERSSTNYDARETLKYRPVKVYVEGVAKSHSARTAIPDIVGRTRNYRKQRTFETENTKWSRKQKKRRSAPKVPETSNGRSMDSGDDVGELPDDIIETVAKANTVNAEYSAHILPEIRAAPCPIHTKRDKPKGPDSIYSTNSLIHVKSPRRLQHDPVMNITVQKNPSQIGHERHHNAQRKSARFDINVKLPDQYPAIKPSLPKNMSSKDYVMTWLIHGSAPQGSNHFPDIVPNNHVKTKKKKTPRRPELSE